MKVDKDIQETHEKAFYEPPLLVELALTSNGLEIVLGNGDSISHELDEGGDDLDGGTEG